MWPQKVLLEHLPQHDDPPAPGEGSPQPCVAQGDLRASPQPGDGGVSSLWVPPWVWGVRCARRRGPEREGVGVSWGPWNELP